MDEEEGGLGLLAVVERAVIDMRPPFKSVKEAVMLFGERFLTGEVVGPRLKQMREEKVRNESNWLYHGKPHRVMRRSSKKREGACRQPGKRTTGLQTASSISNKNSIEPLGRSNSSWRRLREGLIPKSTQRTSSSLRT